MRVFKLIFWWLATALIMLRIFTFSAEPAATSNETSIKVAEKVVEVMPQTKDLPSEEKHKLAIDLNGLIRKYAHFIIYVALGLAAAGATKATFSKHAFVLGLLLCLLYASSDELHQLFVSGRACRFTDILIDFGGAVIGTLIYYALLKLFFAVKRRFS